jgi:hypothetical protein
MGKAGISIIAYFTLHKGENKIVGEDIKHFRGALTNTNGLNLRYIKLIKNKFPYMLVRF